MKFLLILIIFSSFFSNNPVFKGLDYSVELKSRKDFQYTLFKSDNEVFQDSKGNLINIGYNFQIEVILISQDDILGNFYHNDQIININQSINKFLIPSPQDAKEWSDLRENFFTSFDKSYDQKLGILTFERKIFNHLESEFEHYIFRYEVLTGWLISAYELIILKKNNIFLETKIEKMGEHSDNELIFLILALYWFVIFTTVIHNRHRFIENYKSFRKQTEE